jgi:hypothetical protein
VWSAAACHRFLLGEERLVCSSDHFAPTLSGARLEPGKARKIFRPIDPQRWSLITNHYNSFQNPA